MGHRRNESPQEQGQPSRAETETQAVPKSNHEQRGQQHDEDGIAFDRHITTARQAHPEREKVHHERRVGIESLAGGLGVVGLVGLCHTSHRRRIAIHRGSEPWLPEGDIVLGVVDGDRGVDQSVGEHTPRKHLLARQGGEECQRKEVEAGGRQFAG